MRGGLACPRVREKTRTRVGIRSANGKFLLTGSDHKVCHRGNWPSRLLRLSNSRFVTMLRGMTINDSDSPREQRPVRRGGTDYWQQTRRPWPSLVFLLPLLMAYEVGVLWIGGHHAEALRGGADDWLRSLLGVVGLDAAWWPPLLIVLGLLGWQWVAGHPWRVPLETLGGMFAESVLFAFLLVLLGQLLEPSGQLQNREFAAAFAVDANSHWVNGLTAPLTASQIDTLGRGLSFVGAGIYEEFIFRLTLLPLGTALLRQTVLPRAWAPVLAVIATSVLFAAAHHAGPAGEPFKLFPFCFRWLAGTFFAALFVLRGFGITVGSHAMYDLLVGLLLAE